MSETELRVVCRECGSEVSPYVTECPYCGARVRKRAPKLEHHDDHFEALPPEPSRWRRLIPNIRFGNDRLGAMNESGRTVPALFVIVSAVVLVAGVAADLSLASLGAVAGPIDGEWWRYLTAPFAYDNVGYVFAVAVALAIFGAGIERRLGRFATFILLFGCGALGAFGGYAIATAIGSGGPLIAGGNGIALGAVTAWVALRRAEVKNSVDEDFDVVGVGVVACVLLVLPLAETSADVFAGLCGAIVGMLAGLISARMRPNSNRAQGG